MVRSLRNFSVLLLSLFLVGFSATSTQYDRFSVSLNYNYDKNNNATVTLKYCNQTDLGAGCTPANDFALTRGTGDFTGTVTSTTFPAGYNPGDVIKYEMLAADADGAAGTPGNPLTGTVTLAAQVLTIAPDPSANMNITGGASPGSTVNFTLTNSGNSVSNILSLATLGGTNPGNFEITSDGCVGITIAASGGTCVIGVRPIASADGAYSATLSIGDTMVTSNAVALSGTASGFSGDVTPPTDPTNFTDGSMYIGLANSPIMNWTASTDADSGMSHYEIAIGTTAGGTNTLAWTNVGNVTQYQASGLSLTGDTLYYASIRAKDVAGNTSNIVQGNGWRALNMTKIADTVQPQARGASTSAKFGESVAVSSDGLTMALGAYSEDTDASGGNPVTDAGAVFVYVYSGGAWQFQQKIVGTGTNARGISDYFGGSVALGGASGDTLAVGVYNQDYDATGDTYISQAGAVFVYTRSGGTWSLEQKIVAEGTNGRRSNDEFGFSIALGGTSGDTLAVGAINQDYDGTGDNYVFDAGAAYIFTRTGSTWSQQQKVAGEGTNARGSGDYFAWSVALGGASGDTLAVGVYYHAYNATGGGYLLEAGGVYVYTRTGSTWSQQQKIVGTGTNGRISGDWFGFSVALGDASGDTLAVGSFGHSFNVTGGGYAYGAGAVFVFTRTGSTWSLQQKIISTGTNGRLTADNFGYSIALGGTSGNTLAVGAYDQDYDVSGGGYLSKAGAAYVFTRSGSTWSQEQKIIGVGTNGRVASDEFGRGLALGGTGGDTLAVGVYNQDYDSAGGGYILNAGAAYVNTRSGVTWSQTQKIVDTVQLQARMASTSSQFGVSVAMSSDGVTMAVGATADDTDASGGNYLQDAGAVFVYVYSAGIWQFQQKIVGTGTNGRLGSDNFGASVALGGISGDTLVVGAIAQDYDNTGGGYALDAGAVYVYMRSGSTWSLQQKIVGQGTNGRNGSDNFGTSVAVGGVNGDTLAVGAYYQDYDNTGGGYALNAGAVYVYMRSGSTWSLQQKIVGQGTNGRLGSDNFGLSVDLDESTGDTLAVGVISQDYDATGGTYVSNAGAAYVFTRTGSTWSQQQKIVGQGTNGRLVSDNFGFSVALGGASGDTLAVGAYYQDYDAAGGGYLFNVGAAYVFTRSGSTWSQQQKIVGTGTNGRLSSDYFGGSVNFGGANGDTLVVGAFWQDYDAAGGGYLSNAGAVYVFTRSGVTWSQQQKIVAEGTNRRFIGDNFGRSAGLGGAGGFTLAVGSSYHAYDASGSGYVVGAGAVFVTGEGFLTPDAGISLASSATVTEGSSASLVVSLTQASAFPTIFNYATSNGSAIDGASDPNDDYTTTTGTITIAAGNTSATLPSLATKDDSSVEGPEYFNVALSNFSSNVWKANNNQAIVAITDGEPTPTLNINNSAAVAEGTTISGASGFIVSLTSARAQGDTVFFWATGDGTAIDGASDPNDDYTTTSGYATIAAGATSTTLPNITTRNDASVEGSEYFTVTLSNIGSNVTAGDLIGTAVLYDDDGTGGVIATYSGQPINPSNVTSLNVTVGGTDVAEYQYKVGVAASTDCTNSSGYSADTLIATLITTDITGVADGLVKLCLIGKSGGGTYQPYAAPTEFMWVKDATIPSLGGTLADGSYYNSLVNTPILSWSSATDTGGTGIAQYELAIGTTAGGTEIQAYTSVGNVTSYQQTGLSLTSGITYYASVRARDNATNLSSVVQSDGWMADTTVPTDPTSFSDGSMYIGTDGSPIFNWTAATDAHSGINGYLIAIGTTAGGTDILAYTNIGNVTSYQATGLSLTVSTLYYASIKAIDNAGNNSSIVQGNGWRALGTQKIADTVQPQARTASTSAAFGEAVALSSDGLTMALGAYNEDTDAAGGNLVTDAGAVFVYVYSGGAWQFQQKIIGTGTNGRLVSDKFGGSVALGGASGDTLAVGVYNQDYDATGDGYVSNAGAVFVYTRSGGTWSLEQKIVAEGTNARRTNDQFGYSIALGGTSGDTLAVGAIQQDYDGAGDNYVFDAGAAYIFTRTGSTWSQQQKVAGEGTNARGSVDYFAWSVALGGASGDTLAVGVYYHAYNATGGGYLLEAGGVYVYTRTGSTWSQQQKIVGTGTNGRISGDWFGFSVTLGDANGDTLAVGSFGHSFNVSGGGYAYAAGAVFVFARTGSTWSLQQKIISTGTNGRLTADNFGYSIALGGTGGNTLAVGAYDQDYDVSGGGYLSKAGAAYVFTRTGSTWSQEQKIIGTGTNGRMASDEFGRGLALGGTGGDTLAVGVYNQDYDATGGGYISNAGAAYVNTRSGVTWSQVQKIVDTVQPQVRIVSGSANYGNAVAVSSDGLTMAVGANSDDTDAVGGNYFANAGAVFVYVYSGGTWQFQQKIVGTGTNGRLSSDSFGSSVALGGTSGDTLAVGATGQDYDTAGGGYLSNAGAVYVFIRSGSTWSLEQKIVGTGTNGRLGSDNFGYSVALGGASGDTLAAGARWQDYDTAGGGYLSSAGALYVFTRSGSTWSQQQKIVSTGTNGRFANDLFGYSVALGDASGDTLAVGAYQQDYDATGGGYALDSGAVYVFTRSGSTWSLQQKIVGQGTNGRITNDQFGYIVALGGVSGDTLAAGVPFQDYDIAGDGYALDAGAAYVFTRSGVTWSQQQKIVGEGTNGRLADDYFGLSLALGGTSGDTLAVAAQNQDYNSTGDGYASNAGAVYVYTRSSAIWSHQQKIVGTGTNGRIASDNFGSSVAIGGANDDTLAVGAPPQDYDATGANNVSAAGAVFVYH